MTVGVVATATLSVIGILGFPTWIFRLFLPSVVYPLEVLLVVIVVDVEMVIRI